MLLNLSLCHTTTDIIGNTYLFHINAKMFGLINYLQCFYTNVLYNIYHLLLKRALLCISNCKSLIAPVNKDLFT